VRCFVGGGDRTSRASAVAGLCGASWWSTVRRCVVLCGGLLCKFIRVVRIHAARAVLPVLQLYGYHCLITPNFSRAIYIGKAEIDYRVCDQWLERDERAQNVLRVFDRVDNQKIMRMDISEHTRNGRRERARTFVFHELDAANQDPDMFDLPQQLKVICNPLPPPPGRH